ncbi:MAG: YitT family protein [Oscillospiraceae bacterium]|nr:YitT family protein [Oscillospiraceae bacterium]
MNKKVFKSYALCVAGALLVAVGVYFFKFPNNFSTGGVSGLSVILRGVFRLRSASAAASVINAALLVLGFLFLGRGCGLKTVVGTFTLSGALLLFEKLFPMSAPLTDEPLLELVFAILLPAVGSAILFNNDGSTGGTDIVAMILRRYTSVKNIGLALFISDIGITLGAFFFGVKTGLFSVLGLILKTVVIDSAIENINLCKCFSIITDAPQDIAAFISDELHRSCTILEGTGGFTHGKKYLVIAAMKRYQATQLQKFLRANYPATFMMITNSSEVIGKGFRGFQ